MSETVENAKGAHLVGSLQGPDAEAVMRLTAGVLGRHLYALTDGETGERAQWIFWQLNRLLTVDGIEMAGMHELSSTEEYSQVPAMAIAPEVTELESGLLGYAEAAKASYEVFKSLRDEGVIPAGVRFQVSVPTAFATIVTFVRIEDQARFLPVYEKALEHEVAEIVGAIDARDLLIQFDVAVEIGVLTGAFASAPELNDKAFAIEALRRALQGVPAGDVERGIHLCYGDLRHTHFTVPEDLSLCVEIATAVADAIDFVHMPADRDTGRRPSYYEPLRGFSGPRVALGVVDYEGDAERTRELTEAAAAGAGIEFAVATECGMARIDERRADAPSLEQLFELHAAAAAPVR